jgi:hypothetical protein
MTKYFRSMKQPQNQLKRKQVMPCIFFEKILQGRIENSMTMQDEQRLIDDIG